MYSSYRSSMSSIGRSRRSRSPDRNIAPSRPSEIDWKCGEPIAESPSRNTGVLANGWSAGPERRHRRLVALRARYRSSGMRTMSRSPRTSPWVSSLILSMKRSIDCATLGKVARSHTPSNLGRHRLVLVGTDAHDAGHVGGDTVVVRAVDRRDELVAIVLGVLGVLADLVAVVELAVQEGDDERVLEQDVERVRDIVHAGARHQLIPQQRPAARAVDEDVARVEHRDPVLHCYDRLFALHRIRPAPVDQIAEGALDGVERAEPEHPGPQAASSFPRGPS